MPIGATPAQSAGDARAFIALRASHIGALTPLMSPAMIARQLNGAQLALRYGLLDELGVRTHAIAGSGIFGVGLKSSLHVTGGITDADCPNCEPALLVGVGGDMRFLEVGEFMGPGSSLSIAVSGDFGYAQVKPENEHAIAIGIGVPISLTLSGGGREGLHFVPFLTPMLGIGSLSDCPSGDGGCQRNGTRFVVGGGIGVWNPMTSISASIGINHVSWPDAKPVFGVNVVFGGR
jgi:hypothetical protein